MEKLERLQKLQTTTQEMMIEVKGMCPKDMDEKSELSVILMNLSTTSKEINSLILKTIKGE